MQTKMFAIFDSKASAFMQPFFTATRGLAIRSFIDLAGRSDTVVSKYLADFTLFEIALFDDSDGKIVPLPAPVSIGSALELFSASQEEK